MKQKTKVSKLLKSLINLRGGVQEELETANLDPDTRYEKQLLEAGLWEAWAKLHQAYELCYGEE